MVVYQHKFRYCKNPLNRDVVNRYLWRMGDKNDSKWGSVMLQVSIYDIGGPVDYVTRSPIKAYFNSLRPSDAHMCQ